jgi:DNA-binding transcriptional LysR family regulator
MLNLNQLRVFHAVATRKSFTLAADAVHLTQPGISKHIKELEESYGVRLFKRRPRSIALTQAGEILLAATQQIIVCLEKAERQLKELGNAPSRVALAATFTLGHNSNEVSHFHVKLSSRYSLSTFSPIAPRIVPSYVRTY